MQAQTHNGGVAEATTPAADLRLVSVEHLKKIHRDLDACQKVIWLAGCRPRVPNGFDPSYVTDAQERLKEIEALLAEQPQADQTPPPITCEQIQKFMTGGDCPKSGALGECAAIWRNDSRWTAALYIWDASFYDSTAVAKWFHKLGAIDVFIGHTLYCTNNGDRNGEVAEGGARQWLVEFSTREVPHAN
ncbi:hypothetical protein [Pseudomonas sp. C2B4]|uniref:hypothetical protein n=1 Tax=Pseudomonas sp. C2B4 TaxID=2735270 RepID=UPI0015860AA0|nr:hypothetical protein [Pseudomonas sp. C2B4]NUU37358.1 hypothetical protein [Pseudomonas sp. C2B4]